jgi:hypothetical protein
MAEDPADGLLAAADRGELMETFVHHTLSMLVAACARGCLANDPNSLWIERVSLALWLERAPLLCVQTRDILAASPVYAPLLFYQLTGVRTRPAVDRRFLDGVPRSLALFGAPTPITLPVEQMAQLEYADAINERMHTYTKLDVIAEDDAKLSQLAQSLDRLPDLAAEVPKRVRIFVSRQRSVCAGLRAANPDRFRQCDHAQCHRLFMVNRVKAPGEPGPLLHDTVETDYWDQIAPMPRYEADACRFCSSVCAAQWCGQMRALFTHAVVERANDLAPPSVTPPEPSACRDYERAIQRNQALGAAIGKIAKRRAQRARALTRHDVAREIEARVTRANIDLGLLFASMLAMRSPQLVRNVYIPGQQAAWRTMATRYGPMARRIARLYEMRPEVMPIHDALSPCPFMSAVRTHAIRMLSRKE